MSLFRRQIALKEIGDAGQSKLQAGRVGIIGMGALGTHVAEALLRAGIGYLFLCDADTIEDTNLHRQTLYNRSDLGLLKVRVAKTRLEAIGLECSIEVLPAMLSLETFAKVPEVDVLVDATDQRGARLYIDELSLLRNIPWVHAGIDQWNAQLSVFRYKDGIGFSDLFSGIPTLGAVNDRETCANRGVLGATAGIVAHMQALEVLKILLNLDSPLHRALGIWDVLSWEKRFFLHPPSTSKPLFEVLPVEMSLDDMKNMFQQANFHVLDFRLESKDSSQGFQFLSLETLTQWKFPEQLKEKTLFICICEGGIKSKAAAFYLQKAWPEQKFISVKGGFSEEFRLIFEKNIEQ